MLGADDTVVRTLVGLLKTLYLRSTRYAPAATVGYDMNWMMLFNSCLQWETLGTRYRAQTAKLCALFDNT